MGGNVIPRKATKMDVTFKVVTSVHQIGQTVTAEKDDRGYWIGGGCLLPLAMLRNENVCTIKVLD